MKWYHWVACFFGGAFVANFVPHFVSGITGATFPTPFADPPGRGLSSPTINILWALFNIAVGYLLLRFGRFRLALGPSLLVAFVGFAAMALMLSNVFAGVAR